MKNKTKHIIKKIEPGSIAEELELEPGDELLRVNWEEIEDVFDYHFQTNDSYRERVHGSVPFLQQQLHFLFHRSDAAGNASHLVF